MGMKNHKQHVEKGMDRRGFLRAGVYAGLGLAVLGTGYKAIPKILDSYENTALELGDMERIAQGADTSAYTWGTRKLTAAEARSVIGPVGEAAHRMGDNRYEVLGAIMKKYKEEHKGQKMDLSRMHENMTIPFPTGKSYPKK